MGNSSPENSQSDEIRLSIDYRLFCGTCGLRTVNWEDNRVPGNPNAAYYPIRQKVLPHGCMTRPIMLNHVNTCVVKGVLDEVFAVDTIDKTARRIWLYFQKEIEKEKKHAFMGQGIIEEVRDEYRNVFLGADENKKMEPLLRISPTKGNYFDDYISEASSKKEIMALRHSDEDMHMGWELINGAEYHIDNLTWSEEGLRQFLRTRNIPKEKLDAGPYCLADFIRDIVGRVNIFDDWIDIIFLPVDECVKSGKTGDSTGIWCKRVPFADAG